MSNAATQRRLTALLSVCVLSASGCTTPMYIMEGGQSVETNVVDKLSEPPVWEQAKAQEESGDERTTSPTRQLVYSARFQVSAENVETSLQQLVSSVAKLGGYLESRENARVVCRIPAAHFGQLVEHIPTLGLVVHQSIKSDDVTRQHTDLKIRLEAAETSRRRVLALMQRAEKVEDIINLETELRKLTELVEQLQSAHASLGEQIAYSRVEVYFEPLAAVVNSTGVNARSPFPWLNRIGVEQALSNFGTVPTDGPSLVADTTAKLPGGIEFETPEGFLIVEHDREQLRAITPDEAKLWIRRFPAPRKGDQHFWLSALKRHLISQRGYKLLSERAILSPDRSEETQLEFETVAAGQRHRYLLRMHVEEGAFPWSTSTIRVMEFVATEPSYQQHAAALGVASPTP